MIGRSDMLKPTLRPKAAARRRKSWIRSRVSFSGSPKIANTSQCLAPISSAPSDEPPKNSGGQGC
jgi:hypothetical protein